jgi:hypothetical protein
MSQAQTEPTGFVSAGPTGAQFTRSWECQITMPGYESNDENVIQ